MRSDWLTQGPKIDEFEEAIAEYCNVKYAVAVSNGTAALHAAYFAAGIDKGDQIVTSGMTFAATGNAALYLGATPLFADIEIETGNIDPKSGAQLMSNKTRALVGIDFAGHPCDADELREIAHDAGAVFIVDGAQSLGASYKNIPAGGLADMTTMSLHAVKSITTGEGGLILTDNPEYAHKLRLFRTHGISKNRENLSRYEGPWFHEMQLLGFNYRLTDMQAALGTSQLKQIDSFLARRREIAELYRARLASLEYFTLLEEKSGVRSAYHLFPILVNEEKLDRRFAVEALHAENIGVQIHYIPVYHHPYYEQLYGNEWIKRNPITENFYSRVMSLPIFPRMSNDDVEDVVRALGKIEASVS